MTATPTLPKRAAGLRTPPQGGGSSYRSAGEIQMEYKRNTSGTQAKHKRNTSGSLATSWLAPRQHHRERHEHRSQFHRRRNSAESGLGQMGCCRPSSLMAPLQVPDAPSDGMPGANVAWTNRFGLSPSSASGYGCFGFAVLTELTNCETQQQLQRTHPSALRHQTPFGGVGFGCRADGFTGCDRFPSWRQGHARRPRPAGLSDT